MANRVAISGFDTLAASTDGLSLLGGVYETTIVRSGAGSIKWVAVSGAGNNSLLAVSPGTFVRFYVRVTVRPATTARQLFGSTGSAVNIKLKTDGTLQLFNGASSIGTSTTALTDTTKWYRVEFRTGTASSVPVLVIDGNTEVTGSPSAWTYTGGFGPDDAVADTYTAYFDDYASDNTGFPGDGKVKLALPTTDQTIGSGWTDSGGAGSNLFASVDNTPPIGIADTTGNAGKQVRNASSNSASYSVFLNSYTALLIGASDTVNAVQSFVAHGAPVSTGAKTGSQQLTANPAAGAATAFAAGVSNDYWTGTAAGTFPTGWAVDRAAIINNPTISDLGTAPTLSLNITGGTASRIAMCCAMGMYVDYTPATLVPEEDLQWMAYPQFPDASVVSVFQ